MLEFHIPDHRELVDAFYAMKGWHDEDAGPYAGDFVRNALRNCVPMMICRDGKRLCLFTMYDFEFNTCSCYVYLFERDIGVWRIFPFMMNRIFEVSGLAEINCSVSTRRPNSERIARKIGFREVGKTQHNIFFSITKKEVQHGKRRFQ
jgi:hypothetical protein